MATNRKVVVKIVSETWDYQMVDVNVTKGFFIDFSNFVLNLIKFSFNSLSILIFKELV